MIIEESTYLQHHGIKGMRWGVRKEKALAKEQDHVKEVKKTLAKTAVGLTVTAGAMFAAHILLKRKGITYQRLSDKNLQTLIKNNEAFLKQAMSQPAPKPSSVPKKVPKINSDAKNVISDITKRHNESIRLANADLKANYERLQTPLPLREYLKEWT